METLIYNNDDLRDEDIDEIITRIKVIIINKDNKMLLARNRGVFYLPGGRLEENETLAECLTREVKEETGIVITDDTSEPFFLIKNYLKNYRGSGTNRLSEIYYFAIFTDQAVNMESATLTDDEKYGGFHIIHIDIKDVREFLTDSVTFEDEKREVVVNEILEALDVLKEHYGFKIGEEYAQI